MFAHKCANPFIGVQSIPPPCVTSCSFCLGEYNDMFPWIMRDGFISVMLDIFVGSTRIEGRATIRDLLLKKLCGYKGANRICLALTLINRLPHLYFKSCKDTGV